MSTSGIAPGQVEFGAQCRQGGPGFTDDTLGDSGGVVQGVVLVVLHLVSRYRHRHASLQCAFQGPVAERRFLGRVRLAGTSLRFLLNLILKLLLL